MQKPTENDFARAEALKAEGKTNKEIMGLTGLSHSQLERHLVAVNIDRYGGYLAQPENLTVKAALVAKLRLEGQSWGVISVRLREPESRTARDFKEATGLRREGMRIGQGGRFINDDARHYLGSDRAKLGQELTAAQPISEQIPDPDAEETRRLAEVARAAEAAKTPRKRAPRKAAAK